MFCYCVNYVYFLFVFCIFKNFSYAYINYKNPITYRKWFIRDVKLRETNESKKPYIDNEIIEYFKNIRSEFPFFQREQCPIYFDNAATTQKPRTVIERINKFYEQENANIHRGLYKLSVEVTTQYENVRDIIKSYINCSSREEIIFTSGATIGFNLISEMVMEKIITKENDEVLLTYLEHHSNIIPWQEKIKKYKKGKIKYIPLCKTGFINIKKLKKIINQNTKVISFSHVSNVIGNIQNIKFIIKTVRMLYPNIIIILDSSQSFAHLKYNLKKMKKKGVCPDIIVASIHKCFGPLGTGFIYINKKIIEKYKFKPLLFGGNIITDVSKFHTKFVTSPYVYETGTPNIPGVLSMGSVIKFLSKLNWKYIAIYEMYLYDLLIYYLEHFLGDSFIQLPLKKNEVINRKCDRNFNNPKMENKSTTFKNGNLINSTNECTQNQLFLYTHNVRRLGLKKVAILPLWSNQFSSFDLATFLDFQNICIRAGNHCSALIHKYFFKNLDTARVSISFYNTPNEILYLATHVAEVSKMLSKMKQ